MGYTTIHENLDNSFFNNIINASNVYYNYYQNKEHLKIDSFPKLIYRYHEYSCDACIYKELSLIHDLMKEIGRDRILILPSYEFSRSNIIRLKNDLADFEYFNLSLESLNIPKNIEGGYSRYFFIVNNTEKIELVFFPSISSLDKTKLYLDTIKNRFLITPVKN
ncbi:hypothetical protein [Proteiniphilum acetatigenes]|nr:hypothetical protein [Proteiniphilum acetatigenes]SFK34130.1 hypothetical protein SAMN05216357_101373 [Porphyromonadaceae bacterium KH3CP3RA]